MVEGSGFENRRTREGSRGSNPLSSVSRACGSCGAALEGEATERDDGGRTWTWRCGCGWAAARTEAAPAAASPAREAVARALERLGEDPLASPDGSRYGSDSRREKNE